MWRSLRQQLFSTVGRFMARYLGLAQLVEPYFAVAPLRSSELTLSSQLYTATVDTIRSLTGVDS